MTFSFLYNQTRHNSRLHTVLKRLSSVGITLNSRKCEFCKISLVFLWHHWSERHNCWPQQNCCHTTDGNTEICFRTPQIPWDGKLAWQILSKHSWVSKPLQELLSAKKAWLWTPTQDKNFTNLKKDLTTPNILTMYDPSALVPTQPSLLMPLPMAWEQFWYRKSKVSGILLHTLHAQWPVLNLNIHKLRKRHWQQHGHVRSLPPIYRGRPTLEMDYKPVVPLLSHQHLDKLPPRVLRFCLRLMRFDYVIKHVPGKSLHTADALWQAPFEYTVDSDELMEIQEIECHIPTVSIPCLSAVLD